MDKCSFRWKVPELPADHGTCFGVIVVLTKSHPLVIVTMVGAVVSVDAVDADFY